MNHSARVAAVLFDLDGTLLDTAPDMVAALHQVMVERSRNPLPYELARSHVSNGVFGLLRIAFGELADDERNRLRERFVEISDRRLAAETRLFWRLITLAPSPSSPISASTSPSCCGARGHMRTRHSSCG